MNLNRFIICLAKKIAKIYPSNCADEEDYIQAGYLKLAEICKNGQKKCNFYAYAIVAVARAMRRVAINAMYVASAPYRIKKQIHKIEMLLSDNMTEDEICRKLNITHNTFATLRSLIIAEPWYMLLDEHEQDLRPFSVLDDLLSSAHLTPDDKVFIRAKFDGTISDLGLSRKDQWLIAKNIRKKLVRSGYGI